MDHLKAMIKAAKAAGRIIMQNYCHANFKQKEDNSFVSQVDTLCEERIKEILKKAWPSYGFIGEESGTNASKSEFVWVVDPLDGTNNYMIKYPFFDVSIALAKENVPIAGVVYQPFTKELFYAEKGKGALLNGKPIKVSGKNSIKPAVIGYCHGQKHSGFEQVAPILGEIKRRDITIRQFGAAALELSFVGAGRIDAFLMTKVNSWDVAAGQFIVQEAGGTVTDFQNKPFNINSDTILATNGVLHKEFLTLIRKIIKV